MLDVVAIAAPENLPVLLWAIVVCAAVVAGYFIFVKFGRRSGK
jgi:hypothetical protein